MVSTPLNWAYATRQMRGSDDVVKNKKYMFSTIDKDQSYKRLLTINSRLHVFIHLCTLSIIHNL